MCESACVCVVYVECLHVCVCVRVHVHGCVRCVCERAHMSVYMCLYTVIFKVLV